MARSEAEILAVIEAQEALEPSLQLGSGSAAGRWAKFREVIAFVMALFEQLFDSHKVELQQLANSAIAGTDDWLVAQAKYWQYGNPSLRSDSENRLTYSVDLPGTNIIKFASVKASNGVALLKVAKADGAGLPIPLSAEELESFSEYRDQIQLVGTRIGIRSVASDSLRIEGTVYFNALYPQSAIQGSVEEAIITFCKSLPLDGRVYRQKLEDAIKSVPGVTDLALPTLEGKRSGGNYNGFIDLSRFYDTYSGHIRFDSAYSSLTYSSAA